MVFVDGVHVFASSSMAAICFSSFISGSLELTGWMASLTAAIIATEAGTGALCYLRRPS